MTVRRGAAWGEPGALPADGVVVHDDASARVALERARATGLPLPVLGLLGGDLARTCGGSGDARRLSSGGVALPVDLGVAVLDGVSHVFVAHLVARRACWRGRAAAVMNAQFLGRCDMAPRSHPNDGRLDLLITEGLSLGDRLKARRRLPMGTHVPHPAIQEHRVAVWTMAGDPIEVWLDGTSMGRVRSIEVGIEPDALTVVV